MYCLFALVEKRPSKNAALRILWSTYLRITEDYCLLDSVNYKSYNGHLCK